jgi:hypothetical protein
LLRGQPSHKELILPPYISRDTDHDRDRDRDTDPDHDRDTDRDRDHDNDHDNAPDRDRDHDPDPDHNHDHNHDQIWNPCTATIGPQNSTRPSRAASHATARYGSVKVTTLIQ